MPLPALGAFPSFLFPFPSFPKRRDKTPKNLDYWEGRRQETVPATLLETATSPALKSTHLSYIRCARCGADICYTSQIVSKGFTGRHGRAYLVSSSDPHNESRNLITTSTLPNTKAQRAVPRDLVTGVHTVADINCTTCGSVLGWKYIAAEDATQQYKVGKYVLETKRITVSSCWDFEDDLPSSSTPPIHEIHPTPLTESPFVTDMQRKNNLPNNDLYKVEFDSQDEDECEDLFEGIWSPDLARRHRLRNMADLP